MRKINKEPRSWDNLIVRRSTSDAALRRDEKKGKKKENKGEPVLAEECDTHLAAVDNVVPVPAAVIHHIDVIQVGVGPVHQLLDHVQRHGGGLLDFVIHQPRPVGAVHVAALHFGRAPVVGEEQHPVGSRVQCVSARIPSLSRRCTKVSSFFLSLQFFVFFFFSITIITRHQSVMSSARNLQHLRDH